MILNKQVFLKDKTTCLILTFNLTAIHLHIFLHPSNRKYLFHVSNLPSFLPNKKIHQDSTSCKFSFIPKISFYLIIFSYNNFSFFFLVASVSNFRVWPINLENYYDADYKNSDLLIINLSTKSVNFLKIKTNSPFHFL